MLIIIYFIHHLYFIDKKELLDKIESLESEKSETSVMMVALKEKLKAKEGEVVKLQQSVSDSVQLQHKITQLECSLNGILLSPWLLVLKLSLINLIKISSFYLLLQIAPQYFYKSDLLEQIKEFEYNQITFML